MDEQKHKAQGRTNYDWVNGMRIGIIVGAAVGLLLGLAIGGLPAIWLIIGGAAGGFVGAKMAPRW
ncbi:MAG: hypothetical protein U9N84_07845 [Actinomycetota bacterium]|nr:hypothetical protein [Actinomycetota bacterium]